ncbi:type IIA DNA topoisomerase subunit B [Candidatus Nomurabacteria bacterium]|nr:type IIA DNA topoisomerase subunit B [Candidatus Nomurabacteria bacterium]USN94806.1 MAG: type IIA DNA topoisomerase subunit B [Candidatus Nomurabacteria bacterium]
MPKEKKESKYGADQISVLEGLEPVRKRPGMYIGTTGPEGLHHLIWEIFDNSRDEAMGGFCDRIEIALLPGNKIRVVDNGRGIPTDTHSKTKVSALETIMTTLHAGGKFGGEGYKVSGGLHGVGASVVNALSVYMKAEVHRDGSKFIQEYSKGIKKYNVKKVGKSDYTGTIVTFEPDIEIFKEIKFDWNKVVNHMRQQAYLVKGLRISILDLREWDGGLEKGESIDEAIYLEDLQLPYPDMSFCFDGGLVSLIRFQNRDDKPVHSTIFYVEKEDSGVGVEVALQYIDDIDTKIIPFANNIYQSEGGTHVTGFKTALTRLLNTYAKKNNLVKESDGSFTGEDVLEGLVASISVKLEEIQFEGQTKAKLGSTEAQGAVATVFGDAFGAFLEEKPEEAKAIINKALLAVRARKAAKAAKDSVLRKGALEGMTLPGKLADCSSKNAADSEIFIVEGDSAGGTAKTGRDRTTQAVLPLRGKILNIERARLDKILSSEQVKNLVVALGTSIGEMFDIDKLRYHKVIIATDADVDGSHIRTLILTLLFRYFRPLIDGGFIYIAQPPLYKIKKGKEIFYAYTDDEKNKITGGDFEEIEEEATEEVAEESEEAEEQKAKNSNKWHIQRYKGLGEMNAEELWETTMDPSNRILKQVTIEDATEADKIFDTLMGSDVAPRKSFIQSHAEYADIDV